MQRLHVFSISSLYIKQFYIVPYYASCSYSHKFIRPFNVTKVDVLSHVLHLVFKPVPYISSQFYFNN